MTICADRTLEEGTVSKYSLWGRQEDTQRPKGAQTKCGHREEVAVCKDSGFRRNRPRGSPDLALPALEL